MPPVTTFPIAQPLPWGFLDTLEVDPCGLLRLIGWSEWESLAHIRPPAILLDTSSVKVLQIFRTTRPDVQLKSIDIPQAGIVIEYLLSEDQYSHEFSRVSVMLSKTAPLIFQGPLRFDKPHYSNLFDSEQVLGREHIYGFGPPNPGINPEMLPLTKLLRGRTLDFGCGSGVLVQYLRSQGVDARGLELDREPIRTSLDSSISPFISLYDGSFPSPYPDKSFDGVYSSEVLEHIPHPEQVVQELARLTKDRLVLTTPDMSAIPIGFRSSLIPWHLLEATHVNFFTQTSLTHILRRHFSRVEFGRICPSTINGSSYYVSLVAFCRI